MTPPFKTTSPVPLPLEADAGVGERLPKFPTAGAVPGCIVVITVPLGRRGNVPGLVEIVLLVSCRLVPLITAIPLVGRRLTVGGNASCVPSGKTAIEPVGKANDDPVGVVTTDPGCKATS